MTKTLSRLLVAMLLFAAAGAAVHAKTLRLDESAPGELDPGKATDYADSMLMFNIYDTLIWVDSSGEVIPHVAESWDTSDDGTVYTFSLRDDVNFHDGTQLTASDVVFSMERMLAVGQGFSYLFEDWVTDVEAIDEHTVSFTLSEPYAPFLGSLVRLPLVNEALVLANLADGNHGDLGDYGQNFLSNNDAGSGAYSVESHNPQELTVMHRFDDYFLADFAERSPDEIRLRYSLEASTVRTLMTRGEHDIGSQWLPTEVVAALVRDGFDVMTEGGSDVFYMKLNTQSPPTDDIHFRRAMALAFDYDALLSILEVTDDVRLGERIAGPLPRDFPGADSSLEFPRRDLEAARAELEKSKYDPSEVEVVLGWVAEVPLEEKIALLMQQNMSEIGIRVSVVKTPWTLMVEQASQPDTTPNVTTVFVAAPFPDADALLYSMYHSKAAGTWLSMEWLQEDHIDALLDEARLEVDSEVRNEIYAELQAELVKLQPDIFGYEQIAAFPTQPGLSLPTLQDPDRAVSGIMAGNWLFRLINLPE